MFHRAVKIGSVCVAAAVAFTAGANWWVLRSEKGRLFSNAARVPRNEVALVLGCSRRLHGGWSNPFFEGRMQAAAALYREGKARSLLLSGDNHVQEYDEPRDMREALLELGVPSSQITLDYAGFRTLDSMARARRVFGLRKLTIVTDDFHAGRALFLAGHCDLDAVALESRPVPLKWSTKV